MKPMQPDGTPAIEAKQKLFLIDGMSLIYRSYYALSHLTITTATGIPTGGILGFMNTLLEVIKKEQPTHIVVALDSKEKTFRHTLFPDYKSHRLPQPEAISIAIPHIKSLLDAWGIELVECIGYEADDIIGTLAFQAAALRLPTYIMSTDKDLAQIVGANTYLYKPGSQGRKATILGEPEVLAIWGINRPTQVCDILALSGDATDFIPGIPGIGIKTAQKLIQAFDSVENVLAHSRQSTDKLSKKINQYSEQARLSKQLAIICREVPITLNIVQCGYKGPNRDKLEPLLDALAFKQLKKRLWGKSDSVPSNQTNLFDLSASPESVAREGRATQPDSRYKLVHTLTDFQALVAELISKSAWAFAITGSITTIPHQTDWSGIAFSMAADRTYYVSLPRDASTAEPFIALLKPLLAHPRILKIGHCLKEALLFLQRYGLTIAPPLFDMEIAHSLTMPERTCILAKLSETYRKQLVPYSPPHPETDETRTHTEQIIQMYASEASAACWQHYAQMAQALEIELVADLFYQVEMPLIPVLAAMEQAGVSIDIPMLKALSKQAKEVLEKLETEIYSLAKTTFNINAPSQLGKVLFEQLTLDTKPIKTKTGQYATNEAILAKLSNTHPIVPAILAHRALKKLRSTYMEALPTLIHPVDQRLHTTYQQAVVTTGRLSSIKPNLQNIPIRTEQGAALRKAFIPHHQGDYLLSADYSQIELRIMAMYTQDATMIKTFQEEKDIHQMTASKLFNVSIDQVDADMRRQAKMANFGIMYGISPFGLSKRIGHLSTHEAAQLIAAYFDEFPAVKTYIDKTIADATSQGYVTTLLGRKRFLPGLHAGQGAAHARAMRYAINTPIQGSAAELIKVAMINIHDWLQREGLKTKMIMQVHDELVFNVPAAEINHVQQYIPTLMSNALPLKNVPMQVHCRIGHNWGA